MRSLLTAVATIFVVGAAHAQGEGVWFADAKTGCKYFDNQPEPSQTIAWSGPCVNGFAEGRGKLDIFVKGKPYQQYEGDMKAGKSTGHGTARSADGYSYTGGFLDNKLHGHGVEQHPDGTRFEGEYVNDQRNGHGVYTWPDGTRFEGEYRNDKPNGQGTYVKANQTYDGNWVNGCFRDGNRTAWVNTTQKACGFK